MRPWRTAHWTRRGEIKTTLRTLWHRQRGRCAYCARATAMPPVTELRIPGALYASRDHRHPRARGGGDARSNLAMACEPCNQIKGDMPWAEWLAFMAAHPRWWEIHRAPSPLALEEGLA